MELKEARERYLITTRIDLSDEDFIELIEPTSFELKDFGEDSKTNYEILQKLLSKKLVNHSFTEDGVKAKNEKVAAMLLDSGRQFTNIIQIWMESIKLDEKKSGKSDK